MLLIRTNAQRLPEKQYSCHVCLEVFLGLSFQLSVDPALQHTLIETPSGAQIRMPDTFLPDAMEGPVSIVSENAGLEDPYHPGVMLPVMGGNAHFKVEAIIIDCGLDIFAAVFFMLSRWEESLPGPRDPHGRFPAAQSLAQRMGFLDRAVVQEYVDFLWNMLQQLGYRATRTKRQFSIQVSHDVDHPLLWWKTTDRLRTLAGSLIKRKDGLEFQFWLKHLKTDPFDTFGWLMDQSEKAGLVSHFNFMGQRSVRSDCYYPLEHPFVKNLMGQIEQRGHVIGFHPSYESFDQPALFQQELDSLQKMVQQKINTGRQHYLRFEVPDTWAQWEAAGMAWDSTAGYPEAPGFRCGTCYEFPVFDLKQRKTLQLREKPLIAMEVTLALYQGLTPAEALQNMLALRKTVQQHGGEFVLLWHNSSLNDYFWQSWKAVYLELIQSA
jgi:hypothetical protein